MGVLMSPDELACRAVQGPAGYAPSAFWH